MIHRSGGASAIACLPLKELCLSLSGSSLTLFFPQFDGDNMYMNENNHEFISPNQVSSDPVLTLFPDPILASQKLHRAVWMRWCLLLNGSVSVKLTFFLHFFVPIFKSYILFWNTHFIYTHYCVFCLLKTWIILLDNQFFRKGSEVPFSQPAPGITLCYNL